MSANSFDAITTFTPLTIGKQLEGCREQLIAEQYEWNVAMVRHSFPYLVLIANCVLDANTVSVWSLP